MKTRQLHNNFNVHTSNTHKRRAIAALHVTHHHTCMPTATLQHGFNVCKRLPNLTEQILRTVNGLI